MSSRGRLKTGSTSHVLNGGIGKQADRDEAAIPIPDEPRNRRQRRALAAWKRKQAKEAR